MRFKVLTANLKISLLGRDVVQIGR